MSDTSNSLNPSAARKQRKRRQWSTVLLLLIVAAGSYWYWQRGQPTEVSEAPLLATVERGTIENTIASAGTLKPSRYVDVGAQVSGQLQRLHVAVGDVVEQGQLLAEIDARVQAAKVQGSRASIAALEAQLDARRAALELARANAARQERLMADNASSQLEFDTAVNNLASAESALVQLQKQIEQNRASLSSEETQLEYTKIYAPDSGTVVSISMIEGTTLNAVQMAPTILRIANMSTMTVEADISEADIGNVRKGMEVYFTTLGSGTRRWNSVLRQVLPTPEVLNNVVLYTGLFDIDNTDGALFAEMTAQVYFITSSAHDVLTVPLGALTFAPPSAPAPLAAATARGQATPIGSVPEEASRPARGAVAAGAGQRSRPAQVTVVKADGTREARQVLIGVTSRVTAEVISGLSEGEQVIAGILQAGAASRAAGNAQGNFGGGGFRGF